MEMQLILIHIGIGIQFFTSLSWCSLISRSTMSGKKNAMLNLIIFVIKY